jgi:hypothetical protein
MSDDLPTDAPAYRVWCEDCDLDEEFHEDDPPNHVVDYWGATEQAVRNWSARSAARGSHDNHRMSAFRDYDEGLRHRVHIAALDE